ncbi:MAG TPA: response regulator transcription factor [Candidatus Limnocylindria bacterium]|nr:response regulator transcription factor [Candidatus Limnocylindria bacterium]
MHLLVVEDDPRLGRLLKRLLEGDRHLVELASSGRDALDVAEMAGLDAMILDIGLPDVSGLQVAERLRANGDETPILMLTARDAVEDRVRGLDAGADDYLVKPFSYEELAARLRALDRRRRGAQPRQGSVLRNGPIALDELRRAVRVDGRLVELTPREFSLLECFLRHPGQVLSRQQLLDHAWPYGDFLTPNSVDTYVHYLRDKLGDEGGTRIGTVRGVGYRMAEA